MIHFSNALLIILITFSLVPVSTTTSGGEGFSENLFVGALRNGDLLTVFNFISVDEQQFDDLSLHFPWIFLRLFEQFSIETFRLSIAQGFWRTEIWGPQHLGTEVPSGTELSVKFADGLNDTKHNWQDLVHAINGLFCTSILGLLPQFSVRQRLGNFDGSRWWYGALGGESVCTENLQSWKKLFPCKQSSLVALMEPTNLLSARFHSVSVEFTKRIDSKNSHDWHFSLTGKTVHDLRKLGKESGEGEFTLGTLLNRKLSQRCPVAVESRILIQKNIYFDVLLSVRAENSSESNVLVIDLNLEHSEDILERILFKTREDIVPIPLLSNPSSISMHSFVKSVNQIGGRFCTQIENPLTSSFSARFMQMLPWRINVFLHTLTFSCSKNPTQRLYSESEFTLAREGIRPLLIEMEILLPANSKCKIEFEYVASFLKISEFPPDANSGILIPGAVLSIAKTGEHLAGNSILRFSNETGSVSKVFGEPLLILLPVPDFSMPFNVICFVCTTIAIFYGNAFALSTKIMKLFPKEADQPKVANAEGGPSAIIEGRPNFIKRFFKRISWMFCTEKKSREKKD